MADGKLVGVRFTPLTPARLVEELAAWCADRAQRASAGGADLAGTVIGFDGPAGIGATVLADAVAASLRRSGRPVFRATTDWWWRPAALRLELGRQDVDMLLDGWVDDRALQRELIAPLHAGASVITRLRDPSSDRSVRQRRELAPRGAMLLLDGPFLLAADLDLDALIGFAVSPGTLRRTLPADRQWWSAGFARYERDHRPSERADVLLSYDHATAPAASGLVSGRLV